MDIRFIKTADGYTIQGRQPYQTKWTKSKALYSWNNRRHWVGRNHDESALRMFMRWIRAHPGHRVITIFGKKVGA